MVTVSAGQGGVRIREALGRRASPTRAERPQASHQAHAAGTAHDWRNAGDMPASVIIELSPVGGLARFEAMIATLFGLANTGRTNAKGLPSALQLALTAAEFSDVIQMTKPPAASSSQRIRSIGPPGADVVKLATRLPTIPTLLLALVNARRVCWKGRCA